MQAMTKKLVALCDKERCTKVASLVTLQHMSAPDQPSTASNTQVTSAKSTAPAMDHASVRPFLSSLLAYTHVAARGTQAYQQSIARLGMTSRWHSAMSYYPSVHIVHWLKCGSSASIPEAAVAIFTVGSG
jgi:hypothetical protein